MHLFIALNLLGKELILLLLQMDDIFVARIQAILLNESKVLSADVTVTSEILRLL